MVAVLGDGFFVFAALAASDPKKPMVAILLAPLGIATRRLTASVSLEPSARE
jgi:hypothetical protein